MSLAFPPVWQARAAAKVTLTGLKLALIALVIVLLLGAVAVQTVRLEGFKLWPIEKRGWIERAETAEAVIAEIEAAQEIAAQLEIEQRQAEERRFKRLAREADDEIEQTRDTARAAVDRYIADNRGAVCVRNAPDRGSGGHTGTAGEGDTAGIPVAVPADPLIPVAASDLRACAGAVAYAIEARRWALELEAVSDQDPVGE